MDSIFVKVENGRYDARPLLNYLSTRKDGQYKLDVVMVRKKRSLSQNAWLWGCIYPMLLNGLNAQGWEFTTCDEVHEFFKTLFMQRTYVNKDTGEVIKMPNSTAKMTTIVFSEYCEQLRKYAYEFLNLIIPDPIKEGVTADD